MKRRRERASTADATADDVRAMMPTVTITPTGWLALSAPQSPLNIGVVAATKSEARERFGESVEAWARLRELPDPYKDGQD